MKKFLITNNHQIIRFTISGLIASSINFLFYSLVFVTFNKIIFASIFGYSIGLLTSFVFAKLWVFRDKSKMKVVKSLLIFCLIYILGGLEMSIIVFFLNKLISNHQIAWLFGAFIGSLNNFLGSKYLLFKD